MTRTTPVGAARAGRVLAATTAVLGLVLSLLYVSPAMAGATTVPRQAAATWSGNEANPHGGTDYYVDRSAGSDSAAGTSAGTAWATLAKASSVTLQPGDRLLLKAGETWNGEQLNPQGSGAAGKPITVSVYGSSATKPYIATNGRVPSPFVPGTLDAKNPETVGMTGAINLRNQHHWEIRDVRVSNDDDFAADITDQRVVRDGISVSINADLLAEGQSSVMKYFRITGVEVRNIDGPSFWQKIHYGGINFQVFGSKQWTEYESGGYHFEDVEITHNTFDGAELHAIQFGFNWFGNAQGQTDETGKFHEGWEQLWVRTKDFYSRDVLISHNYAENTGQGPIQLANTKDMIVEYNELNGFLERYRQVSAGLYLWAGADSVMRYNQVYDGPFDEFDATPWDLEFTNFNVTYEYNYSHDNAGGWMAYMGNSSNSVARYNLSVNDNGVLVKNMLSTNYSPTYFLNNVFVYDGAKLHQFHDEVFKSTIYFLNNVFYNTSTTTPTTWFRKDGALDQAVFSHNAFFEASGRHSPQEPQDAGKVTADPKFVTPVSQYDRGTGVENIEASAAKFKVAEDSPLRDAGRYNPRVGTKDFFGTPIYYGAGVDIGLHEQPVGDQVVDPTDTDPIEDEGQGGGETRPNLALGKPAVASSTHPHGGGVLSADKLTDGRADTRWAAADDATYPLTVDIDLGAPTTFNEVRLKEFVDSGTPVRIGAYELQRWDAGTSSWVTFHSGDGVGTNATVDGFGLVTSSKLRLSINGKLPGAQWSPTMTEIEVYGPQEPEASPQVSPATTLHDLNPTADPDRNVAVFDVDLDGTTLSAVRYVGSEGNVLGSLTEGEDYTVADGTVSLTPTYLAGLDVGSSGLRFEFAAGAAKTVALVVVDTRSLEQQIARARAVPAGTSAEHQALAARLAEAEQVLADSNRQVDGPGNDTVTPERVSTAESRLKAAVDAVPTAPRLTNLRPPTVAGSARPQGLLTAHPGTWSERGVRLSYQWLRDGEPVRGATSDRYRVTWLDAGSSLRVRVTARKDGMAAASAESAARTIDKLPSTTRARAFMTSVRPTTPVLITAQVRSRGTTPTGTVQVHLTRRDGEVLASKELDLEDDGLVQLNLGTLPVGKHRLVVTYSGSDQVAASVGSPITVTVRR